MKKIVAVALLVLVVGLLAIPAFAASTDQTGNSWLDQRLSWLEQKMSWQKAQVDSMVQNGTITEEQGKIWKEHFDEMYKFQQENGFICPGGGPGWRSGMGGGNGYGPGMGMRGGFGTGAGGWQQQGAPQEL